MCGSVEINSITCNAMIGCCDQAGQWQRALDVLLGWSSEVGSADQQFKSICSVLWKCLGPPDKSIQCIHEISPDSYLVVWNMFDFSIYLGNIIIPTDEV